MVKMPVDGADRDYIKLQFAGADILYVPALQLDLVSKYIGGGDDPGRKRLSKLGGTEWEKSKTKAKKAAKDMAKGLIQLYAQRQRLAGHAFAPDTPWQKDFEALFPYPETEDQLRCAAEIKADMEKSIPMDRLLCGDVGYGKTEVAFRAIMKCVLEGKQAALLVPTTVLAQQHYLTALQRFCPVSRGDRDDLPVPHRRTDPGHPPPDSGGKRGPAHRHPQASSSKDIRFHDLGLLVVDEEQRFGVGHKEKLKKLTSQVDVLTLSATPIPRTLNMALSGLRDMSTLEQPPTNRQPVQTYVLEHDWGLVADAIRRELDRGGQVYYLHNRTETIDRTAAKLRALLGESVRIATAHGKMDQEQLGDIMSQMTDGELDILVCTTIIETGIDLPNVNTLIIENAETFGLAQLHQIRGRVGRSTRRAAAYLTYRPQQGAHRGPVQAAVRHPGVCRLWLRVQNRHAGPGNPGGGQPAGARTVRVPHERGVRPLPAPAGGGGAGGAGQARGAETLCTADFAVARAIPERYIPAPEQRMDLYRRIARVRTQEEGDDITDELIDRYGDPPVGVANLIAIALLRARAAALGITELVQKEGSLRFSLPSPTLPRWRRCAAWKSTRAASSFPPATSPICPCG
ncbi:MAG: TRCF domain-containing protein [Evtepia gabavorous]